MDSIGNIVFLIIVIASIVFRAKKAAKKARARGTGGDQIIPTPYSKPAMDFKSLFGTGAVPPRPTGLVLGGKDMDKLASVYGSGAVLGTDEVSILLNVSESKAQEILNQMQNSGRATQVPSASGKIRYKLV